MEEAAPELYDPLQPLDDSGSEDEAPYPKVKVKKASPCPVTWCPATMISSVKKHVVAKHLPKAAFGNPETKDPKKVEDIFKERRRFWEYLAKVAQYKGKYEALAESVRVKLQERERRPAETVPPQLATELALHARTHDDRRIPATYITNLGDYAMYSWRVAACGLNEISKIRQQRLRKFLDQTAPEDLKRDT